VYHLPYITSNPNLIIHAFYQRAPAPENGKPHCTVDYPDAKHYADLDEFLKDSEIELVCVLTQYDTHAFFAEKALLAGKHGMSVDTPNA
jgi:predicted dehydrogenase